MLVHQKTRLRFKAPEPGKIRRLYRQTMTDMIIVPQITFDQTNGRIPGVWMVRIPGVVKLWREPI